MIKKIDIRKALSRKKLWEYMGYKYIGRGVGYFRNNHTLNYGCGYCKEETNENRRGNKKRRASWKLLLKKGKYENIPTEY